jgi:tRNA-dihydrouridine synthase A
VAQHLKSVDGVMIGREAYRDPYLLTDVDSLIFDEERIQRSRWTILAAYKTYIADQLARGVYLKHMSRHLLGFFHGEPGARAWRSHIGRYASDPRAGLEVIEEAERKVQAALGQAG